MYYIEYSMFNQKTKIKRDDICNKECNIARTAYYRKDFKYLFTQDLD